MKHLKPLLLLLALAALGACTHSKYKSEAHDRAISAATQLLALDTVAEPDTTALERAILQAKAIQGEYLLLGDTIAANEFDKTFRSTVTEADTALARLLFIPGQSD